MFTKKSKTEARASAGAGGLRRRGRPAGRTEQGTTTRLRLYKVAIKLIASKGYDATTLRDIAREAGVSVGLLYRYFPSKRAVVLALYDELSQACAGRASSIPPGNWRTRFLAALAISMEVLRTERETIAALVPVLVGDADEGLFAPATAFSRQRVEDLFQYAVSGASDAPSPDDGAALARVLYVTHLAVILWWLLDKSPAQRATDRLLSLLASTLPVVSLTLRMESARAFVRALDALLREGLFGEGV